MPRGPVDQIDTHRACDSEDAMRRMPFVVFGIARRPTGVCGENHTSVWGAATPVADDIEGSQDTTGQGPAGPSRDDRGAPAACRRVRRSS